MRFLDVRLSEWPAMMLLDGMLLSCYVFFFFTGWSVLQIEAAIISWSLLTVLSVRMLQGVAGSVGKDPNWNKLPELLPLMVRSGEYKREEAIQLYDLFFYHEDPRLRAWDLRSFAPLPPKEYKWFLEG